MCTSMWICWPSEIFRPSSYLLLTGLQAGGGREGAHPRCWGPCGPIRSDIGIRSGGRTKSLLDKNNVPRYPVANTDINPQLQAGCSENEDRPTEPPTLGKADPLSRRPSERPTHWAADSRKDRPTEPPTLDPLNCDTKADQLRSRPSERPTLWATDPQKGRPTEPPTPWNADPLSSRPSESWSFKRFPV